MELIIHTKCGLPVELCECPDANIKYDWDGDRFMIKDTRVGPAEEKGFWIRWRRFWWKVKIRFYKNFRK